MLKTLQDTLRKTPDNRLIFQYLDTKTHAGLNQMKNYVLLHVLSLYGFFMSKIMLLNAFRCNLKALFPT